MNDLANTQTPARNMKFYKSQNLTLFHLIKTYLQDKTYKQNRQDVISYTSIENLKCRANYNIILDYAETSTPLLPSFYVTQQLNVISIVIRGTSNRNDKNADIETSTIDYNGFKFHRGFFVHATGILEILQQENLVPAENNQYIYQITGHSMGGAISAILGYLIGEQIGSYKNIRSFGSGMACCGNLKFSQFAKQFHYCIVNRCDVVPAASIHSLRVLINRLLGQPKAGDLILNQDNTQNIFNTNYNQNLWQNNTNQMKLNKKKQDKEIYIEINKRRKCDEDIETKILSQKITKDNDLFAAGHIFHFIDNKLYYVDVHDISEAYFDYLAFLDHFGYYKVSEYIIDLLMHEQK